MKKHWREIVVLGGACCCLLLAVAWIVNAAYWRSVTGSWLDHHITDYETAPIFFIAGSFFFLWVVSPLIGADHEQSPCVGQAPIPSGQSSKKEG